MCTGAFSSQLSQFDVNKPELSEFFWQREFRCTKDIVLLLLFAGKDDASSLDSVLHSLRPDLSQQVLVVETGMPSIILQDQPYG